MIQNKEEELSNKINFCTECNEDLDNFDIDPNLKTKQEVLDNHENCKETGKFKGEKCSKLFIEEADDIIPLDDED